MAKQLKVWTTLGFAALGAATLADAAPLAHSLAKPASVFLLAQTTEEAGEAGENGGEGGGATVGSYALGSTDANAYNYDASAQIAAYAELVHDAYAAAATDAGAMKTAIDAFLAAPSPETLEAARKAWVSARPAYLRTEAFRFYDGPIEKVEGAINAWPLNEAYIDYVEGNPTAGLVNDGTLKLDIDSLEGLNQKQDEADVTTGWHAIEFLLWGQDLSASGPGNRPHTDYVAGSPGAERRRLYLQLVTAELVKELDGLAAQWQPGDAKNYAGQFAKLAPREAVGRMVNGMAILAGYEFMSERLGVALDSGDQEDEQSCFSDTTKQDFVADFDGLYQVWTGDSDGKTRPGLNDLVFNVDSATADKVERLFEDVRTKVNALGDPWDQVLAAPKESAERKAAEDLVTALQALSDGLVDAGNKLGVLVLVPTE